MSNKQATHDVIVHKANIALQSGESIGDFTQALSEASRAFFQKSLSLVEDSYVYTTEVYSSSAVVSVSQYGKTVPVGKRYRYFAVSYSRNKAGIFDFSNQTEVIRKTVFQAKPQGIPITKAMEPVAGWIDVAKSFWNGVV